MVDVGSLRRRVRIERVTTSPDGFGHPLETWDVLDHVWADVKPLKSSERFAAAQVDAQVELRLRIHYRADVTRQMRILFDDVYYDIQGIREVGFREGLELLCGLWKPEGG